MSSKFTLQNNFGLVIFVVFGFLTIPQLYYISNIQNFEYDLFLLLAPLISATIIFAFGLFFSKVKKVQYIFAGFGISILFCDQFLRPELSLLDGSDTEIVTDITFSLLNLSVYVGVPILFLMFGRLIEKVLKDLAFISVLMVCALSSYSTFISFSNRPLEIDKPSIVTDAKTPNVYLIWLDAMETGAFNRYSEETNFVEELPGFSFFPNNSANYLYSEQSYVSFMSGKVFKGGNYTEWEKGKEELRINLIDSGYDITSYAKKEFLSTLDYRSYVSTDLFKKYTGQTHPFITDFVTFWIVRSFPSMISESVKKLAARLGRRLSLLFQNDNEFRGISSIAQGIEPASGVFTLKQVTTDEKFRPQYNQFVLTQAVIPHAPYIIDDECNFRGLSSKTPRDSYYDQAKCSFNLVRNFLAELKKLNRYNSSMILIMGDHGSGWGGQSKAIAEDKSGPLNSRYTGWNKSKLISRVSALLMVKPANSENLSEFTISNKESQLVDIYPTILHGIGQGPRVVHDIDGYNLFGENTSQRSKYFSYFKPGGELDQADMEIYDIKFEHPQGITDIVLNRTYLRKDIEIPSIKCVDKSSFSLTGNALENLRITGASASEDWGRWSNSELVEISFNVDSNECVPTFIEFNLRAFVNGFVPKQSASIWLNDREFSQIEMDLNTPNPQLFSIAIPENLIKFSDINVLSFKIKDPKSPKSLQINSDTRKLAFGFIDINFKDKILDEITCNKKYNFLEPESMSRNFLIDGLSEAESSDRWSNSEKVHIKFIADRIVCEPTSIKIDLKAFLAKSRDFQSGYVKLNGQELSKIEISALDANANFITVHVPNSTLLLDEINNLEIFIDNPVSPQSLGISNDSRTLGFSFQSIEFR